MRAAAGAYARSPTARAMYPTPLSWLVGTVPSLMEALRRSTSASSPLRREPLCLSTRTPGFFATNSMPEEKASPAEGGEAGAKDDAASSKAKPTAGASRFWGTRKVGGVAAADDQGDCARSVLPLAQHRRAEPAAGDPAARVEGGGGRAAAAAEKAEAEHVDAALAKCLERRREARCRSSFRTPTASARASWRGRGSRGCCARPTCRRTSRRRCCSGSAPTTTAT